MKKTVKKTDEDKKSLLEKAASIKASKKKSKKDAKKKGDRAKGKTECASEDKKDKKRKAEAIADSNAATASDKAQPFIVCCHCLEEFPASDLQGSWLNRFCPHCGLSLSEEDYDSLAYPLIKERIRLSGRIEDLRQSIERDEASECDGKSLHESALAQAAIASKRRQIKTLSNELHMREERICALASSRYYASEWHHMTGLGLKGELDERTYELIPGYEDGTRAFWLRPASTEGFDEGWNLYGQYLTFETLRKEIVRQGSALEGARLVAFPSLNAPEDSQSCKQGTCFLIAREFLCCLATVHDPVHVTTRAPYNTAYFAWSKNQLPKPNPKEGKRVKGTNHWEATATIQDALIGAQIAAQAIGSWPEASQLGVLVCADPASFSSDNHPFDERTYVASCMLQGGTLATSIARKARKLSPCISQEQLVAAAKALASCELDDTRACEATPSASERMPEPADQREDASTAAIQGEGDLAAAIQGEGDLATAAQNESEAPATNRASEPLEQTVDAQTVGDVDGGVVGDALDSALGNAASDAADDAAGNAISGVAGIADGVASDAAQAAGGVAIDAAGSAADSGAETVSDSGAPFAKPFATTEKCVLPKSVLREIPDITCPHCSKAFNALELSGSYLHRTCPKCNQSLCEEDFDLLAKPLIEQRERASEERKQLVVTSRALKAQAEPLTHFWQARKRRELNEQIDQVEVEIDKKGAELKRLKRELGRVATERYYASEWFASTRTPLVQRDKEGKRQYRVNATYAIEDGAFLMIDSHRSIEMGITGEALVFEELRKQAIDPASPLYGARIIPNLRFPKEGLEDNMERRLWNQIDCVVATRSFAFVLEVKHWYSHFKTRAPFDALMRSRGKRGESKDVPRRYHKETGVIEQAARNAMLFQMVSPYPPDRIYHAAVLADPLSFETDSTVPVDNALIADCSRGGGTLIPALLAEADKLDPIMEQAQLDLWGQQFTNGYGDANGHYRI